MVCTRLLPKCIPASGFMCELIHMYDIVGRLKTQLGQVPRNNLNLEIWWVMWLLLELLFKYGIKPDLLNLYNWATHLSCLTNISKKQLLDTCKVCNNKQDKHLRWFSFKCDAKIMKMSQESSRTRSKTSSIPTGKGSSQLSQLQVVVRPLIVIGPTNLSVPKPKSSTANSGTSTFSSSKRRPLLSRPRNNRIYVVPDEAHNCHRGSFCEERNHQPNESSEPNALQPCQTKSVQEAEIITESSSLERKLITLPDDPTPSDLWDGPSGKTGTVKRRPSKITINGDHDIQVSSQNKPKTTSPSSSTNKQKHQQQHLNSYTSSSSGVNRSQQQHPKPNNFDSTSPKNEGFDAHFSSVVAEIRPEKLHGAKRNMGNATSSPTLDETLEKKKADSSLSGFKNWCSSTGNIPPPPPSKPWVAYSHRKKLSRPKEIGVVGPIQKKLFQPIPPVKVHIKKNHIQPKQPVPLQFNENVRRMTAPGFYAISNVDEKVITNSSPDVNPDNIEESSLGKKDNLKATDDDSVYGGVGDANAKFGVDANSILGDDFLHDLAPHTAPHSCSISANEQTDPPHTGLNYFRDGCACGSWDEPESAFTTSPFHNADTHANPQINNSLLIMSDLHGSKCHSSPRRGKQRDFGIVSNAGVNKLPGNDGHYHETRYSDRDCCMSFDTVTMPESEPGKSQVNIGEFLQLEETQAEKVRVIISDVILA